MEVLFVSGISDRLEKQRKRFAPFGGDLATLESGIASSQWVRPPLGLAVRPATAVSKTDQYSLPTSRHNLLFSFAT